MDALHPRPQMARRRWMDLRGRWEFAYDDANVGREERWYERAEPFRRTIQVPFPPESPASGIGETGFHPYLWYRRVVAIEREDRDKRLILHFGAVDYRAEVWVNGQHVVSHEGGQTPFSADITSAVREGVAVIVVRAEDLPWDLEQPRGKQDWREEPHEIWYHRTSGIWQPVWLEPVRGPYVTHLAWTPDLGEATLRMDLGLSERPDEPVRVQVRVGLEGGVVAEDMYTSPERELTRAVGLSAALLTMERDSILWSPEHPHLLDITVTVWVGEEVVDEVVSYAGLREVGTHHGRFTLNGVPRFLRLVLAQNYWPESHLAAPGDEALRREVELAREMGFNGLRIHQKVEDPRFLYWCDRLGMMVWGEMANAYVYSATAAERLTREWVEVIRRDRSHPCIVTWVPINESWGVPNLAGDERQRHLVRGLYHLTKALDPTRPVIANDGWEWLCGDMAGIHDYATVGRVLRERYGTRERIAETMERVPVGAHAGTLEGAVAGDVPVVISEMGGIFSPWAPGVGTVTGYAAAGDSEMLLTVYDDLVGAVVGCAATSGFCYTQLTDTEGERNGLYTAERTPKVHPGEIARVTARPSAALSAHLGTVREGSSTM